MRFAGATATCTLRFARSEPFRPLACLCTHQRTRLGNGGNLSPGKGASSAQQLAPLSASKEKRAPPAATPALLGGGNTADPTARSELGGRVGFHFKKWNPKRGVDNSYWLVRSLGCRRNDGGRVRRTTLGVQSARRLVEPSLGRRHGRENAIRFTRGEECWHGRAPGGIHAGRGCSEPRVGRRVGQTHTQKKC